MAGIEVVLDGIEPFVRLSLFDGQLSEQPLPHNLWRTTVDLAPGAYLARFRTSIWEREERFVLVPGDERLLVCPRQIDLDSALVRSPAPLRRTSGFEEEAGRCAAELIRRKPVNQRRQKAGGSLFLMCRSDDGRICGSAAWRGIRLFNGDNKLVADLASLAAPPDLACVHIALPVGSYRLCFGAGKKGYFSQFLYVALDHQTRVFAMEERPPESNPCGESPAAWAAAQVSVQIVPSGSDFDPDSNALRAAEELMNILAEDEHPRAGFGWPDFLDRSGSLPLDFAFCLSQVDPWSYHVANCPARLKPLTRALGSVADVAVMACVAGERGSPMYELREPPMTVRAWDAALASEPRGHLRIPASSVSSRAALHRIARGPWLRFTSREPASLVEKIPRQASPPRFASFDFGQTELSDLAGTLRRRVRKEAAMRIPYGSTDFSSTERRFLNLVCPEADNIAYRIMRDLEKEGDPRSDEAGEDGTPPPATCSLAPEDLVKAFQLPVAAIEELAATVIARLTDKTLVPTRDQLESFVIEESAANSVLLEPLQMLSQKPSDIVHCAEEKPLTLLALVYLCYRGKAGGQGIPLSADDAAKFLNGLGFVISDTGSKVSPEDIRNGLKRAEALLSDWSQNILDTLDPLPREGGLWEQFELAFVDPHDYRQGSLCRILKSPPSLVQPIQQCWNDNEFSYSLSLANAADPSRWHTRATSSAEEDLRPVSIAGWDKYTSRRYLEMVKETQKMSLRSLRLRLEAQDES